MGVGKRSTTKPNEDLDNTKFASWKYLNDTASSLLASVIDRKQTSVQLAANQPTNVMLQPKVVPQPVKVKVHKKLDLSKVKGGDFDASQIPFFIYVTATLSYAILFIFGQIRDICGKIFNPKAYRAYSHYNGYAPMVEGFERIFHRYVYIRLRDALSRPITGVPGRTVKVLERTTDDYNMNYKYTGNSVECLNLASYNYLGFSEASGYCTDHVVKSIKERGLTTNSCPNDAGYHSFLEKAEDMVARFVGKPAAIIMSQGFTTNASTIPALVGKGCLIISDELNHTSIIFGARVSGATIKSIKHNDVKQLEKVLRQSISNGQPRTHKPWRKILLIIEGLYSMEGTIPNLPEIIALKRKYKFSIYLDEAHSIGALGPRGRGVCDLLGVDPEEIDIMMGTFTKSFGATGGYIAGSEELINRLRVNNHSSIYGESMSVPVLQQLVSSMTVILGESGDTLVDFDGQQRLRQLAFNSNYFFRKLKDLGFTLIGNGDSPVIPMMIFYSAKVSAFSRECLANNLAVVVVGYPATPLLTDRVRFCLSASHTVEDLDHAIDIISKVGDKLLLKNIT